MTVDGVGYQRQHAGEGVMTIEIEPELKPCPFCGGRADMAEHFRKEMGWSLIHRCNVMGPLVIEYCGHTRAKIIARWNTRV